MIIRNKCGLFLDFIDEATDEMDESQELEEEEDENLPLSFPEEETKKTTKAEVEITPKYAVSPGVAKQVTETGIGNKKIRITVETDIRIKNYLSHLAPINLIRKRFKEKRFIDPMDVEDILNYVIT